MQRTARPGAARAGERHKGAVSEPRGARRLQPAANIALAGEKRTLRFRFIRSIPRVSRAGKLFTGIDVVCRWAAHWADIAVLVQPPSTGGHTDLAVPFKLSHGSRGLWYAVYDHIRYGTVSTIEYIVLC